MSPSHVLRSHPSLRRAALLAGLVALGTLAWSGWYVYNRGFTRKWRALLTAELRQQGLDLNASRLTLNPFEGLVIENANLRLLDERRTHVMFISRAAVDIDFWALMRRRPFLRALDLTGARLAVPVDMADRSGPKVRLRHLQAKVTLAPGELHINQAEGEWQGVQISLRGTVLHPESFAPGVGRAGRTPGERARRRLLARAIFDEVARVRAERVAPRLEVSFRGDLARPDDLRADILLRAETLRRGRYRLASLRAQLEYSRGVLHLRGLDLADARGQLHATGDFRPATREAHWQLLCGLDLPTLAREFWPAGDEWTDQVLLHDTPRVRLEGRARFPEAASGQTAARGEGVPVANQPPDATTDDSPDDGREETALAASGNTDLTPGQSAADWQITGHVALGRCAFRGVELDRVETAFSWTDDRWYLQKLRAGRPGRDNQLLTADVLTEPDRCRVRLSSSLDPTALAALLPTSMAERLPEWKFLDPPRVELSAVGRTPDDLAGFRTTGRLALGRTRFRGVELARFQTDWTLADQVVSCHRFTLERDEGGAAGDGLVCDFGRRELRLDNVHATLDLAQVAVWINPDLARGTAPYRFRQPPATVANGTVSLDNPGRDRKGEPARLTIDVRAPGGMECVVFRRPVLCESVSAQVVLTDERLRFADVAGTFGGGQVRGELELSLAHGAPDCVGRVDWSGVDGAALTRLLPGDWRMAGLLAGEYRFAGRSDGPRSLRGEGRLRMSGGSVFAARFLGPLAGAVRAASGFGLDRSHEGTADFFTEAGRIETKNLRVRGRGFEVAGAGWLDPAADTMDFRMKLNLPEGRAGGELARLLLGGGWEYRSRGPLHAPEWRLVTGGE